MKVLFAPDWRSGISYQQLLAKALEEQGVQVEFLSEYRRILPLARGIRSHPTDLVHLHWPEAYFDPRNDGLDLLRRSRFRLDLYLGTRDTPFVLTAHNLFPHDRTGECFVRGNIRAALSRAKRVMVHSQNSIPLLESTFGIPGDKCRVIPQGDLSVDFGPPLPAKDAIKELGVTAPLCLMFGMVKPYKGIEGVIDFWKANMPEATLAIIGKPESTSYGQSLKERAGDTPNILMHLEFLSSDNLRLWLSAARCVIFNYAAIFNSGGAWLARPYGIPILLPSRATTLNLNEPHPLVIRFEEEDLGSSLDAALKLTPDYLLAADWREQTSWHNVAKATARVYEESLR